VEMVLHELGALFLDRDRSRSVRRILVCRVLLDDLVAGFRLDARLLRVVHAARKVAMGAGDDARRGELGNGCTEPAGEEGHVLPPGLRVGAAGFVAGARRFGSMFGAAPETVKRVMPPWHARSSDRDQPMIATLVSISRAIPMSPDRRARRSATSGRIPFVTSRQNSSC